MAPNGAANAPQVAAQPLPGATYPTGADAPLRAQVTKGSGTLPNEHGQVWREYDITPYTIRNTTSAHPEQAIVDWILRETGYEAWHATPVGLLSADRKVLRVYHTPQMQAIVAEIVDRFVSTQSQNYGFGLRVITMKNPNWRIRALPLMTSIPVQSPGVQGWIMAREDAALLLNEFRRRTDYREQTTPNQMVLNGQSTVISTMRPITYTKGIIPTQAVWPGYQPELGQLDEGFSLEFSPLLVDRRADDRRGGEAEAVPDREDARGAARGAERRGAEPARVDPGAAAHDGATARAIPLADGPRAAVVDGRRGDAGS